MDVHKRWANVEYWRAIKRRAPAISYSKYLKGMDLIEDESGSITQVSEDRRVHRVLWLRTLEVAFFCNSFLFFDGIPNCPSIGYVADEI